MEIQRNANTVPSAARAITSVTFARVFALINGAVDRVIVAAPSGYGKAALCEELITTRQWMQDSDNELRDPRSERWLIATSNPVVDIDYNDVLVTADDLALTADEVLAVVNEVLGGDAPLANLVHRATNGWPALVGFTLDLLVDVAPQDRLNTVVRLMSTDDLIRRFLLGPLKKLSRGDREELAAVAGEDTFSAALFAASCGPDALERFVGLGLPIAARRDGLMTVLEPVRSLLRNGKVDPVAVKRMTPVLREEGRIVHAAQLLIQVGELHEAAVILSEMSRSQLETAGPLQVLGPLELLRTLFPDVPALYILKARALYVLGKIDEAKGSLRVLLDSGLAPDPLLREAEAEFLYAEASQRSTPELIETIHRRMAALPAAEVRTAPILNVALGLCLANHEDLEVVQQSEIPLLTAVQEWEALGERLEAARTLRLFAGMTLGELIRFDEVRATMERAMALCGTNQVARLRCLLALCRAAAYTGNLTAFEGYAAEADYLARLGEIPYAPPYLHWSRMTAASWRKSADEVRRSFVLADSQLGPLHVDRTGAVFTAEAAEAHVRVGDLDTGRELLRRAAQHSQTRDRILRFPELALAGVDGDVNRAERLADAVFTSGSVAPTRRWLTIADVSRAYLVSTGTVPEVIRQRVYNEALAADAVALMASVVPASCWSDRNGQTALTKITMFGSFRVEREGEVVALTEGHVERLVKLLAVRRGSAPVDVVIEALWPDEDPAIGRRRLKNVVRRAREQLGESSIVRNDTGVAFGVDVRSDLMEFEALARVALTSPGENSAVVADALRLVTGPLLQDDLYDDWIAERREETEERVRLLMRLVENQRDRSGKRP